MQNKTKSKANLHESADPQIGRIFAVAVLTMVLLVGCIATVNLMMRAWSRNRPLDAAQRWIVAPDQQPLDRFPKPNLRVDSHLDLAALHSQEDAELHGYGWIDRSNGIVRIPIERAMDLIAERGLPKSQSNRSSLQLIQERTQ